MLLNIIILFNIVVFVNGFLGFCINFGEGGIVEDKV